MSEPISTDIIRRKDLPPVVILLLTKDRTEYAIQTIHGIMRHLKYEGEVRWFVADNGSEKEHREKLYETLVPELMPIQMVEKGPTGECWNKAIRYIFKNHSHIYLRLEDDMVLHTPLDITPYVKIMMRYPRVGMVRLGQMVQDLDLFSEKFRIFTDIGYDEEIMFKFLKTMPYVFSGHPALITKGFHDVYGYFDEGERTAGELEVILDGEVRKREGPDVYFPWNLGSHGTWGAWDHIGEAKA